MLESVSKLGLLWVVDGPGAGVVGPGAGVVGRPELIIQLNSAIIQKKIFSIINPIIQTYYSSNLDL